MRSKKICEVRHEKEGITLIALVITIIVLLILAGVSIAMLTGQNGILTQAQRAKTSTEQANAKEKIELAVIGARSKSNDGSLTIENLKEELSNYGIAIDKTEFPVEIELDGQKLAINNSGKVTKYKEMTEISGQETANTTTKDSLGNYIVVPAGFKIINPNDNVTNGIVIEDVSHSATAGSQFVWIPVGNIIKDNEGNKETIALGRYVFNENGTIDTTLSKTEPEEQIQPSGYSEYFTEGLRDNSTENTRAKDIEAFRIKATNNHGYYIGRYEARKNGEQLTVKANDNIYNNITELDAATLSKAMYSDSNFENDLVNSYAWDTATVFLQKFDNRENKDDLKSYSRQNSSNTDNDGLASQGTNNLELDKQDKICNVYDMASNCFEWTTETSSYKGYPCTSRGGNYYYSTYYTNYRGDYDIEYSSDGISFRPILYL